MPTDRLYSASLWSDRHRSRRRLPRVARWTLSAARRADRRGACGRLHGARLPGARGTVPRARLPLAQTLLGPRGPIDMDRDFAESYPREKRADLRKELDYFAQVRWLASHPRPPFR